MEYVNYQRGWVDVDDITEEIEGGVGGGGQALTVAQRAETKADAATTLANEADAAAVEALAAAAAAVANTRDAKDLETLLANSTWRYDATGAAQVVAGDVFRTRKEGFSYRAAVLGAADYHVATGGGLLLYVEPGQSGIQILAFDLAADGVTDDAAKIQMANDFCAAGGHFLQGAAVTCFIASTVTITCSCDLSSMTLKADARTIGYAVRVGKTSGSGSSGYTWQKNITTPKLLNSVHVPGTNWAGYDTSVGTSIDNVYDCDIVVSQVEGFGVGCWSGGVTQGLAYCNITIQSLRNSKINLKIGPKGEGGFSNDNTYYIQRCRHDSSETNGGTFFTGTKNILLDRCNNNVLVKPCIEGGAYQTEFILDIVDAAFNLLISPRFEGIDLNMRYVSTSPGQCTGNFMLGGYGYGGINTTVVGSPSANGFFGNARGEQYLQQGGDGIAISNVYSDNVEGPHFQGFYGANQLPGKGRSATDWSYRLYGKGLNGKRPTDEKTRLRLNFETAGITFGPGGTTDPVNTISQIGSGAVLGTNAAWAPATDNALDLGIGSLRWRNVYGANVRPGAGAVIWTSGAGSPEGVLSAAVGSMYTSTDGGAGSTLYVKETGSGNTGWAAK